MTWSTPQLIHAISLSENIINGQSISAFVIKLYSNHQLVNTLEGSTVGHKRILTIPSVTADKIEIEITDLYGRENMGKIAVY